MEEKVEACMKKAFSLALLGRDWSLLQFVPRPLTGLVVAGAGCGHGAMGSDEIGRLAASLATTGEWDSSVPRRVCRLQFQATL